MGSLTHIIPLNNDILLVILSHLAVGDVLFMRQVCRTLRDLTYERSVWTWHYAEMVRDRQLPCPMMDQKLSQEYMESAVRRNKLIESAWRRANPKMESLRFVTLTASEHDWIRDIRRGFIVPGGKYFLVFVSDGVYTLSLEELSGTPVSFISLQDVNLEGLDVRPRRWTTGRPDDGSLTFYAAIRPADRTVHTETYAFWSGNFQGPMPTQTYYGQFTILGSPRNVRTKNELFMFNTRDGNYIIVFDWQALLQGGSFRYCAFRTHSNVTGGLEDFCLLPNGRFLVIDFAGHSLSLFPHPEFQTVDHLNQPLPMEYTTPLWQYQYPLGDGHLCVPRSIWSLPLCHPYTDTDESSALLCSRGCGCCYRVAMGSEGPKILGHQMLPDGSRFLPGRTGALVATPLDGEDGLRIGCLRYAPETEWKSDSPQSYATFDVSTANLPGWASDTRPSRCLNSGQIHFNEEGGRICILSKDTSLFRQEATVFVLDVI